MTDQRPLRGRDRDSALTVNRLEGEAKLGREGRIADHLVRGGLLIFDDAIHHNNIELGKMHLHP
jgi:hypothetical protein